MIKVGNLIICFLIESIVFCDRVIDSIVKKNKLLLSIFFKDWPDRLAHGQSFLKIDGIDSLTVVLFKRSRRAIWIDCFLYRKNERLIRLWKRSNCLCRSFLNINRMDSLTVNLFQRSTGSIKSRSIFFVIERLIRSWKDWITSIDFLKIDQIDSLTVNFFKYQWDLFAHSWSF